MNESDRIAATTEKKLEGGPYTQLLLGPFNLSDSISLLQQLREMFGDIQFADDVLTFSVLRDGETEGSPVRCFIGRPYLNEEGKRIAARTAYNR